MNEVEKVYQILNDFCETSRYVEKKQGLKEYIVFHDHVQEVYYADNNLHSTPIIYEIKYYQPFAVDKKYELIEYLSQKNITIRNINEEVTADYLIVSFVGKYNGQ